MENKIIANVLPDWIKALLPEIVVTHVQEMEHMQIGFKPHEIAPFDVTVEFEVPKQKATLTATFKSVNRLSVQLFFCKMKQSLL